MPEWFAQYLRGLSDARADELWKYLDEEPFPVDAMVGELVDAHPNSIGHYMHNEMPREMEQAAEAVERAMAASASERPRCVVCGGQTDVSLVGRGDGEPATPIHMQCLDRLEREHDEFTRREGHA